MNNINCSLQYVHAFLQTYIAAIKIKLPSTSLMLLRMLGKRRLYLIIVVQVVALLFFLIIKCIDVITFIVILQFYCQSPQANRRTLTFSSECLSIWNTFYQLSRPQVITDVYKTLHECEIYKNFNLFESPNLKKKWGKNT